MPLTPTPLFRCPRRMSESTPRDSYADSASATNSTPFLRPASAAPESGALLSEKEPDPASDGLRTDARVPLYRRPLVCLIAAATLLALAVVVVLPAYFAV